MFKFFQKTEGTSPVQWHRSWSAHGLVISLVGPGSHLSDPLLPAYLAQLQDDGYAVASGTEIEIGWDALYEALQSPGYSDLPLVFELPAWTATRPVLHSSNSLTDSDFSIAIAGWQGYGGSILDFSTVGPVLTKDDALELMKPAHWQLFREVIGFARRSPEERSDLVHRQAWGRIRKLAAAADARLDDFLHRSVVLTPDRLEIGLRKSAQLAGDSVVQIEPLFAGAPPDWLERFDNAREVQDRYDVVSPDRVRKPSSSIRSRPLAKTRKTSSMRVSSSVLASKRA